MVLTLPDILQTSEQFLRSSARETEPDAPPKKKREFPLSAFSFSALRLILQKTMLVIRPSF